MDSALDLKDDQLEESKEDKIDDNQELTVSEIEE